MTELSKNFRAQAGVDMIVGLALTWVGAWGDRRSDV
jgi:hypothetical protein